MNTGHFIKHRDGVSGLPVVCSIKTRKNFVELRYGFPSRVVANEDLNRIRQFSDQRAGDVAIGSCQALPDFVKRASVFVYWHWCWRSGHSHKFRETLCVFAGCDRWRGNVDLANAAIVAEQEDAAFRKVVVSSIEREFIWRRMIAAQGEFSFLDSVE
ncbi:MAG: hypothetical protein U1A77_10060 [Pirellulales bacterium]